MKVTELRIGNLVSWADVPCTVSQVFSTHFYAESPQGKEIGISLQNAYSPIPLTAEWLERFGFVKLKRDIYGALDWHSPCGDYCIYMMCIGKNKGKFYIHGSNCDMGGWQFVHQIQNLNFALTGEELKLRDDEKGKKNTRLYFG